MLFREIQNWVDPEAFSGLLYFAQRLDELTFEFTIDSYKAPTTNASFLVAECLHHLNECEITGVSVNSALHILDELEARLQDNIVAKSLASLKLENYIGADRSNPEEIRKRLSVLRREITPYVYALRLMEMIGPLSTTNKKNDLNFLARELVSTLVGLGVSLFHINLTVRKTFFSERVVRDETVLDQFFRDVFPHRHGFTVCFKIKSGMEVLKKELLDDFDVRLTESMENVFSTNKFPADISALTDGQKYFIANGIEAMDIHSAVQVASARMSHLVDMFRMFNHKETIEIDPVGYAEQLCCSEEIRSVPTRINRMQFITDNRPQEAAQKMVALIEKLNLPQGSDAAKFFRVIDFHGMSLDSEIVENQIINMWTSFETIVPQNKNKKIINNVVQKIHPIIGLQYFRRLFKCVTFDIVRWNRKALVEPLRGLEFPADFDLVDKVFYLIVSKKCEERLKNLLANTGNFELLKFRIFQLRQNFETPKHALKTLERHQQRVDWQMYRIYRARNAIIHSGSTPRYAGLLVENAHDYFDQVFSLTCELSSGVGGFTNYTECFDFAEFQYAQFVRELKNLDKFDLTNVRKVLWKPRVVPSKNRFFPDEEGQ